MKLLFDLKVTQPDGNIKRHGGGKYGEIVLQRILSRNLPVCCGYDSRLWLNPEIKELVETNKIELFDYSKKTLQDIVTNHGVSLLYVPTNVNYGHLTFDKCKVLGTIHGLRTLENPIDFYEVLYAPYIKNLIKYVGKRLFTYYYRKYKGRLIKAALESDNFSFVTVSYHSSNSVKSFFPQNKNVNIPVFYSPSTSVKNITEKKYREKFFLLVSANRSYKNNLRAIKALDRLFTYNYADGFRVKVTGVDNPDKTFLYNIKNKDRFDFVGFVDEQELDQLYHDSYCFIYPTLNEGFGYPPLEAMHYGTPVLSSPLSSIPEVCGGSVIYFNPFSIEEIMNRILQILEEDTHAKYSQLARERYNLITKKQNADLDKLIDYIYNFEK